MKITRRQLRRLILQEGFLFGKPDRKILLENRQYYEKIATLICKRDPAYINQGIELAKTMGYIKTSAYPGPRPTYFNKNLFHHQWFLDGVDPGLSNAIENQWKARKNPSDNHRMWPGLSLEGMQRWNIVIARHES